MNLNICLLILAALVACNQIHARRFLSIYFCFKKKFHFESNENQLSQFFSDNEGCQNDDFQCGDALKCAGVCSPR